MQEHNLSKLDHSIWFQLETNWLFFGIVLNNIKLYVFFVFFFHKINFKLKINLISNQNVCIVVVDLVVVIVWTSHRNL